MKLAILFLLAGEVIFGQPTIPCAGTPGNTSGVHFQQCKATNGVTYICSKTTCAIQADWVRGSMTDFATQVQNRTSDQLTYTPVGGVPRTQAAKNADTVSVKDCGAKGDGFTNDQPAIQACVAALHAHGGGELDLPAGIFLLNAAIVPESDIWFKGASINATTLKLNTTSASGFSTWIAGGSAPSDRYRVKITDLTIDGNYGVLADGGSDNYQIGMYLRKVHDSEIARVRFVNIWYAGVENYQSNYNSFHDNIFEHSGDKTTIVGGYYYALGLNESSSYNMVESNVFRNVGSGVQVYSFYVTGSDNKVLNNRIYTTKESGISVLDRSDYTLVQGNTIVDSGRKGIVSALNAVRNPNGTKIELNTITNPNALDLTDGAGIYATFDDLLTISRNTIVGASATAGNAWGILAQSTTGTRAIVTENQAGGNFKGHAGIQVSALKAYVTQNQLVCDTSGVGIYLVAGTTAWVAPNTYATCTTDLQNSGTALDGILANNQSLQWYDSTGIARRTMLFNDPNFQIGDIDNVGYQVYIKSGTSQAIRMLAGSSTVLTVDGSGFALIGDGLTTGNLRTSTAGKGLLVKSPDGAHCGLLGIDNTGATILTSVTCW